MTKQRIHYAGDAGRALCHRRRPPRAGDSRAVLISADMAEVDCRFCLQDIRRAARKSMVDLAAPGVEKTVKTTFLVSKARELKIVAVECAFAKESE